MSALVDSSEAKSWLSQFEANDVPAARTLLRTLELVSLDAFEAGIITMVEQLCAKTRGRIALFAVDPNLALAAKAKARTDSQLRKGNPAFGAEQRGAEQSAPTPPSVSFTGRPSSAGRINHILMNLKRRYPRRLSVNPRLESMRAERCNHIVLIDDLIGSGSALKGFWKAWAHPSVKSWLSFRYCQLWCVTYCAHEEGLLSATRFIPPLKRDFILVHRALERKHLPWEDVVTDVCWKYAPKTGKPHAALGYGTVMCPIVFQHGCPNDCPVILWDSTGHSWKGMFPNRSIPTTLYPFFVDLRREERHAERLWRRGQQKLALSLLESLKNNRMTRDFSDLLAVLGLRVKGVMPKKMESILLLESRRINALLDVAVDLGLTTPDLNVTEFGNDLLNRSRHRFAPIAPKNEDLASPPRFYYPLQLRGAQ